MTVAARRKIPARLLQTAFDACPLPVAMSVQRVLVAVNPAMTRLFGHAPEALLGGTTRKLFASDAEFERVGAHYAAECARGEACVVDTELVARDGRQLPCRIWFRAVDFRDIAKGVVGVIEDLGESARVEAELRRSEERLRYLLSATPAVLFALRPQGDFGVTFMSENARARLGWEARAFVDDPGFWRDHVHPADAAPLFARLPGLFAAGRLAYEYRFRHGDGSWRWLRDELILMRDARGAPQEILGAGLDITERKAAEEALQRSEERLRFLLSATPAVFYSAHPDGASGTTFISDNVRAQLGWEPADFTGNSRFWLDHIHPEDREQVLAQLPALFAGRRLAVEYRFRHGDGGWRWLRDELVLVRDEHGAPREIIGTGLDITDRVRADEELKRSRERLQLALEGSGLALWDANALTGEVYLSERWSEMIGAPPGETRTTVRELAQLAHPEDRERVLAAAIAALKGARADYSEEHRVRTAAGEWRWMLSRGRVVERAPDGRALRMSGTNLDIHERKRTEETLVTQAIEIAAKNRELEASNRFKSEFIARMAHELRTPLAAVLGFAELIEKADDDAVRMQGYAREVRIAGERLRLLVDDILELAEIEAARTPFAPQPVAPVHLIEAALRGAASLAERSGVALASRLAPDLPLLSADERKLVLALAHLLDNAIKYSARGGTVTLAARLAEAQTLELAVEDRGEGIAAEVLPRLFQPFVQSEALLTRRHGGAGLGLALVKRIAELHGGTVGVESAPGEGSTFRLRLPVDEFPPREAV